MSFEEFEKILGNEFANDYGRIERELKSMSVSPKQIDDRIEQLKSYREVRGCVCGAEIMIDFKQIFNLEGDFKPVEQIAGVS